MIKQSLISLKENIRLKTTNPFLGTLILVFIYNNWMLFYTIINLESNLGLTEKIEKIKPLIFEAFSLTRIFIYFIETLIVVSATYLLLNISRLIINLFEKKVTPFVYKITDKSSVVLKDVYDSLEGKYYELHNKYQEERETRIKIQQERDAFEKEVLARPLKAVNEKKEFESKNLVSGEAVIDKIYKIIKQKKDKEKIKERFIKISNDELVPIDYLTRELVSLGIIEKTQDTDRRELAYYRFTEVGLTIRQLLLLEIYSSNNN